MMLFTGFMESALLVKQLIANFRFILCLLAPVFQPYFTGYKWRWLCIFKP